MHRPPGTATWPASGPAFAHLPGVSVWRGPAGSLRGYRVADIFDEVQEDLRAERMNRRWPATAGSSAGCCWWWSASRAAGLALVAGPHRRQVADRFLALNKAAAEPGADGKAAAESFAGIAADAPPGYRTLARLRAAALKAEGGDRPGPWPLGPVARDGDADPLYRDLASLMWVLHSGWNGDPAALAARVAPLAGGPWRASAQELQAVIAMRRATTAEARRGAAGAGGRRDGAAGRCATAPPG